MGTDGLYDRSFLRSKPRNVGAEISRLSLGYSHWTMRGYLHKHRFMGWIKLYCFVCSGILECHTTANISISSPACKLFLPGSKIMEDMEVKRQWAFKIKTRQHGLFKFAADSAEDRQQWIKALQDASTIEMQPVENIDDIRIPDPQMEDLKRKLSATPAGDDEVQYIVNDNTMYMYTM